ncbi:MAG: hypothetical protein HUJ26_19070 [Planctomycetaceae bacterium]|nr:hypothetical protein [Planctomycetaceae bacterium]
MVKKNEPAEIGIAADFLMRGKYVTFGDEVYKWDSKHYRRFSDKKVRTSMLSPDVTVSDVEAGLKRVKWLTHIENTEAPPFWLDVEDCVEDPIPDWYRNQTPIPFENGVLLLEKWLEGSGDAFISNTPALFATTTVPYSYDASAKCPKWMEFMNWFASGDKEGLDLIQQWFGSVFVPQQNHEKFLWLQGAGENGKSVLTKTVDFVIGSDQVGHLDVSDLPKDFRLQGLIGKRINISQEFSRLTDQIENSIKKMTSNETEAINRKFKEVLNLKLNCKLLLVSNKVPYIRDDSDGFYRRMLIFRCKAKVVEKRLNLEDDLIKEAPGIFNWILEGAKKYMAVGNIVVPETIQNDINEIRYDFDMVGRFVREMLVYTGDPKDRIITANAPRVNGVHQEVSAYGEFDQWCEANGHQNPPSSSMFVRRVQELTGCEKKRIRENGMQISRFLGLAWAEDLTDELNSGRRKLEDLPDSKFKEEFRKAGPQPQSEADDLVDDMTIPEPEEVTK